ncbi:RNA-directed DNA polymerase from mobile element jockey [Trichonephila clavipes]|nr:RNA-directed DNA polymerase from mobile element jockey [Trichonephila clavipes]
MWGSNHTSPYSEIFVEWLTNSNFILLNTYVPTHRSNVGSGVLLDFTLCSSNLIGYSNTFVSDSSYNSDQCPVITDFNFHNPIKRTINKVDWRSVTEQVKLTAFGIDDHNLSDNIAKIISNNTQKIKISNKTFPPWWNTICHNLYKLKKCFQKKAIREISPKLWIRYKQYSSRLRFSIKKAKKKAYWDTICNNISNPRIFYILKKLSMKNNPESQHRIFFKCIIESYIIQIQAELFAENFASNNINHEPLPLDYFAQDNSLINNHFHISELNRAIKYAKNTTPGADQLPAKFLKLLNHSERSIILKFFQQIFDNSIVPKAWKHAIILPIPKPCKDKTKISSYRPIALTSVFYKTFERIAHLLITERKLHQQHYGFVPFKDNRTATYIIYKAITDTKLDKKYFVGISLDIKSAYDSVYIDGLIYKCLQIGITGKIALWIHEFLSYRSLQIRWRGCLSSEKTILKDLPQGSVLSPILYTIYMYDFFETLETGVECSIYADDIFIYCSHQSLDTVSHKLQNTLERINQWCKYWKLSLSPDKSTIAELSNKRIHSFPNTLLAGTPLPWQSSIKCLGVFL